MIPADLTLENLTLTLTLTIKQEIHVQAPLDITFAALLEQLGPGNETPDGKSLSLKIEPWPGGRWYRDFGEGDGHLWAHTPSPTASTPTSTSTNGTAPTRSFGKATKSSAPISSTTMATRHWGAFGAISTSPR